MRIFQTKNIIYILKRANQSASNRNFSFILFFFNLKFYDVTVRRILVRTTCNIINFRAPNLSPRATMVPLSWLIVT